MSAHAPKIRALMAYDGGALSQAGRERLEDHLAGCDLCREQLVAIQTYGELSQAIRGAEIPSLNYGRMELALRREARAQTKGAGRGATWAILALAAAVLLGVLGVRQRFAERPQASRLPDAVIAGAHSRGHEERGAATLAQTETPLEGELTAVAGGARVADAAAKLGDSLHEGDVLETDPSSALHGRLAPGTGFVLAADSRLELSRVRPSGIVLSLQRGSVSSAVRTGDVYRVDVGSYRVVVRGTRFSVSRVGDGVQVSLAEGTVAIERGDATLEVLHAPARWRSSEVAESALASALENAPVDTPIALEARLPWPSLTLPPLPRVVAWEVEGARFDAERSVALRAPQGELRLRAFDARGRAREVRLQLAPEGLTLSEAMLPRLQPPRGQLSPDAIRGVVRARQPALRRCYERVLRRLGDPSLTRAAYSLRVDVGARGDVRRVRLTASSGEPHAALRDCITHEVRGWTFPAPRGGPVSFELPLNLSAR